MVHNNEWLKAWHLQLAINSLSQAICYLQSDKIFICWAYSIPRLLMKKISDTVLLKCGVYSFPISLYWRICSLLPHHVKKLKFWAEHSRFSGIPSANTLENMCSHICHKYAIIIALQRKKLAHASKTKVHFRNCCVQRNMFCGFCTGFLDVGRIWLDLLLTAARRFLIFTTWDRQLQQCGWRNPNEMKLKSWKPKSVLSHFFESEQDHSCAGLSCMSCRKNSARHGGWPTCTVTVRYEQPILQKIRARIHKPAQDAETQ